MNKHTCIVHTSPCACGRGNIVVTSRFPDPTPASITAIRYVGRIECSDCAAEFALIEQDGGMCRVRSADLVERAEARKAHQEIVREIETHAEMAGHYDALGAWFAFRKSPQAVHLEIEGMTGRWSYSEFQRLFATSDPKTFVRDHIPYYWLPYALERIGRSDPHLARLLERAAELARRAGRNLPVLELIYKPDQSPFVAMSGRQIALGHDPGRNPPEQS